MASWHQNRNITPLWHTSKWTVVNDGESLSVSRWRTPEEANEHATKTDGYVLKPAPGGSTL